MSTCSPGRKPVPVTPIYPPIVTTFGTTLRANGAKVAVGVRDAVTVRVGVLVLVLVAVFVGLAVEVAALVGVRVLVRVGVTVVGVLVAEAEGVEEGVLLGVLVGQLTGLLVAVGVPVGVTVAVAVARLLTISVVVAEGVVASRAGAACESLGVTPLLRLAAPRPMRNGSNMMMRICTRCCTLPNTRTSLLNYGRGLPDCT
jgi:hypothetical protein